MAFSLWTWACDKLKPPTSQQITLKKHHLTQGVVHLSLWCREVTLVRGYSFWQLSIYHNMAIHKDVHYQVKHLVHLESYIYMFLHVGLKDINKITKELNVLNWLTYVSLLLCRECYINDTLFSTASLWRPWREDRFTSFIQIPSGSLEEACWVYIWKGTIWIRCCCHFTEPLYCICILHFMKRYGFGHFDKLTGLNFKSSSLNWYPM